MTREYVSDSSDIKSIVTVEKGLHTRSDNVEVVTGTVVVGAIVVDGTGRSTTVLVNLAPLVRWWMPPFLCHIPQ